MHPKSWHGVTLATSLLACQVAVTPPAGVIIRCAGDHECPTGLLCAVAVGRCVAAGDDRKPPSLLDDMSLQPTTLRRGLVATLTFTVDEPLGALPVVTITGGATSIPMAQQGASDNGLAYTFVYTARGDEGDETRSVLVSLLDVVGNSTTVVVGDLAFDFVTPTAEDFLWSLSRPARPSETVSVTARSEADAVITAAYLVDESGADVGDMLAAWSTVVEPTRTLFSASLDLSTLDANLTGVAVVLELTDTAGNDSDPGAVRSNWLQIDGAPPSDPRLTIRGKPVTPTAVVEVDLSVQDADAVRISGDLLQELPFTTMAFPATLALELTPGFGPRTLFATYRDSAGNESAPVADVIFRIDGSDAEPPGLLSATPTNETALLVAFDEPVQVAAAADPASYTISSIAGDLGITLAILSPNQQQVILVTEEQSPSNIYSVVATGVADLAGNLISANAIDFRGFGPIPDETPPDAVLPAHGAILTSLAVELAWTGRSGATTYEVEIAYDAGFTQDVPGSPFSANAPATVRPVTLPSSRTYHWRVRADTTTPGTYSTPRRFDVLADGVVHVHCPDDGSGPTNACDDSGRAGTYTNPVRTLAGALAVADAVGATRVNVAWRDGAAYEELLIVPPGIEIYGGYDASDPPAPTDFQNRNVASRPTIIRVGGGITVLAQNLDAPSRLDGLTIRNGGAGTSYAVYVSFVTATLTLADCDVEVETSIGQETAGLYAYAVGTVATPGVVVEDSRIASGGASSVSDGLRCNGVGSLNMSHCIVRDSQILSGDAANTYGIRSTYATWTIERSSISSGNATLGSSYGALIAAAGYDIVVDRCNVRAGAGPASTGAFVSGQLHITNSFFIASDVTDSSSVGLNAQGDTGSLVAHNTCVAGQVTGSTDRSTALDISTSNATHFVNNLLGSRSTIGRRYCVTASSSYATASLQNNLLFDCPTAYFYRLDGSNQTILTTLAAVNDGTQSTLNAAPSAAGNFTETLANIAFAAAPTDYHLSGTSSVTVTQGGKSTTTPTCGPTGTDACGSVTADYDGGVRDNPVSVGADER